jgi:type I restriction enzyme R subunit
MAKLKEYYGHYCESEYEYAFIGFLGQEGWKYVSGNDMKRITKRDVLFIEDLKTFLTKTNLDLTEDEVTKIVDTVRLVGAESDFATLHKVYRWMVNGIQFIPNNGLAKMFLIMNII